MHPIIEQANARIKGLMGSFRLVARFNCRDCQTTHWELKGPPMIVDRASRVSYSKNGTLKLMNRVVTEDVACAKCGLKLIQLAGLNKGVHGKIVTTSFREKAVANG